MATALGRGENINDFLKCAYCKYYLINKPIRACSNSHLFCNKCYEERNLRVCNKCKANINNKPNLEYTNLLEKTKLPCENADSNLCKLWFELKEKASHEIECMYRKSKCLGFLFSHWKCNWAGRLSEMGAHFKNNHGLNYVFDNEIVQAINLNQQNSYTDIHLIYKKGNDKNKDFVLKHIYDFKEKVAMWAVQILGTKSQANYYVYSIEFFQKNALHSATFVNYCTSDSTNVYELFAKQNCVYLTFKFLKNFSDEKNRVLYRIKIKNISELKRSDTDIESVKDEHKNDHRPKSAKRKSKMNTPRNNSSKLTEQNSRTFEDKKKELNDMLKDATNLKDLELSSTSNSDSSESDSDSQAASIYSNHSTNQILNQQLMKLLSNKSESSKSKNPLDDLKLNDIAQIIERQQLLRKISTQNMSSSSQSNSTNNSAVNKSNHVMANLDKLKDLSEMEKMIMIQKLLVTDDDIDDVNKIENLMKMMHS